MASDGVGDNILYIGLCSIRVALASVRRKHCDREQGQGQVGGTGVAVAWQGAAALPSAGQKDRTQGHWTWRWMGEGTARGSVIAQLGSTEE